MQYDLTSRVHPLYKFPPGFEHAQSDNTNPRPNNDGRQLVGVTTDPFALTKADVVSSEIVGSNGDHAIMLDLDVPARLVPSSTEGHSHLYIDVRITWHKYAALLDALADAGVIERGYAQASRRRGATFLRLPWVKKMKKGVFQ